MRARYRLAALGATLLAGMVSTGGTALAAPSTPAQGSAPAVADTTSCCWDHRGHRDFDRRDWRGRGWDHSGSGWNWEQQCQWAWNHDRDWYRTHCG